MKARLIIDDVTRVPHPFVFRGVEYDLQKSFSVVKAINSFLEREDHDDMDIPFVALAEMMNDDLKRKGKYVEPITVEYLSAWIPAEQFADVGKYVQQIINPTTEETPDTSELDALIDDEIPEEVQKN